MKLIPTTYTFDTSAGTITCADFTALEKIAIITNITTGDIIYQFNNSLKGGILSSTTLTLVFDTTGMSDTDILQIIMEKELNPATAENQELLVVLRAIFNSLQMPRNADTTNNADRVTVVNTVPTTVSSGTVTTLSTLNGVQAHQMSVAQEINAFYVGPRSLII